MPYPLTSVLIPVVEVTATTPMVAQLMSATITLFMKDTPQSPTFMNMG